MAGVRPQKLSVSKIKSRLLNVAQSSLYRLTLQVPETVKNKLSLSYFDYDNISLLCCEANLPGSSLTTHEVNNDYHGVTEKMAYRRMYDETVGLTFYVDRNYKVIELLEGWMDYITGVDNKRAYQDPYISYRMAYPKSYKNNIFLTKFERDQFTREYSASRGASSIAPRTTLDYTFVQAFPISVTAIPVSYEESSVLKCSVSFNFVRYVQQRKQSLLSSSLDDIETGETRDIIVNTPPKTTFDRIETWRDVEDEPSGFVDQFGNERF
tara:strand:+ start:25 stop:825 length:801 start_codon:yes stop_codon:yes gene_type:complete